MVISIKPTTHSRNSTMQKQTNLKRKEVKKEDKEKVVIEAEDKKDKKVIEVAVFIDYNYLVRFLNSLIECDIITSANRAIIRLFHEHKKNYETINECIKKGIQLKIQEVDMLRSFFRNNFNKNEYPNHGRRIAEITKSLEKFEYFFETIILDQDTTAVENLCTELKWLKNEAYKHYTFDQPDFAWATNYLELFKQPSVKKLFFNEHSCISKKHFNDEDFPLKFREQVKNIFITCENYTLTTTEINPPIPKQLDIELHDVMINLSLWMKTMPNLDDESFLRDCKSISSVMNRVKKHLEKPVKKPINPVYEQDTDDEPVSIKKKVPKPMEDDSDDEPIFIKQEVIKPSKQEKETSAPTKSNKRKEKP